MNSVRVYDTSSDSTVREIQVVDYNENYSASAQHRWVIPQAQRFHQSAIYNSYQSLSANNLNQRDYRQY